MSPPVRCLDRYSRAILAGISFAAFAGAFVTTPIVVRGAAGSAPAMTPIADPVPSRRVALVLPQRDPFIGDAPRAIATAAHTSAAATSAVPPVPPLSAIPDVTYPGPAGPGTAIGGTIPRAHGALPPNAGAMNAQVPFVAQTARVTAVVTGAHPFALAEDAGTTRLVTVGDRIAGDSIAAIDGRGVRLANGRLLAVAPAATPVNPNSGGR